jgi:two-component system, NtrC family, sensor histidine kinase PilS
VGAPARRPDDPRLESRIKWLLLGRLAVAVVGLGATLATRAIDARSGPPYVVLVAACLINVVWLSFARAGVGLRGLALVQILVDVLLVGALVYLTGIDRVFALLYFGVIVAAALLLSLRAALGLASAATIVLAAVSILYYLAGHPDIRLSLPFVDPVAVEIYSTRLSFLLPFLAIFGFLLHVVALLAGKLAAEISRVRILTDEILLNMAGGVLAADRSGSVQFINPQAARLLGLRDSESARGRRLEEAVPRKVAELVQRALRGEDRTVDEVVIGPGPVRIEVSPLREADGGPLRGAVALINDLSLRTQVEEMTRRAERFQAILEMSAAMAHEIRNPLASIRGAAQELGSSALPKDDDRVLLDVVIRESDRLDEIISEFLEYASDRPLHMGLFDLAEVLRDTVLLLEARGLHNVDIRDEIPRSMICRGEPDKLKQVFLNLGLNAFDACLQSVKMAHLEIRCRPGRSVDADPRQGIIVEFEDDGCGIARENLSRVFDPFFTTKPHGVGMGLAIARKIVRGHGGDILVSSEEGKGTTFRVWLPS